MTPPIVPYTALIFLLLAGHGCTSGSHTSPEPVSAGGNVVTVLLVANPSIPEVNPGDTLDFVLPGARPGSTYWVQFKSKTLCKKKEKFLQGTPDSAATRPHCLVKNAENSEANYPFSFGTGSPTGPGSGVSTDGIIRCPHC